MATDNARAWARGSDRMWPRDTFAPRKLSPQQIDEIKQRHDDGDTVQTLALAYGVTAATIRRYTAA